jgi:hypothetical protein
MHLRGTHCVRSDGKNQISSAQSRWNNGRAAAKEGVEVEDDDCSEAESGRVHATRTDKTAEKSFCAATGDVAAGSDCGAEADSVTQQQPVWQQALAFWLNAPAMGIG